MLFGSEHIVFANPMVLIGIPLVLIAFGGWFYVRFKKQYPTIFISSTAGFEEQQSMRGRFKWMMPVFRLLALILLLIALARPQIIHTEEEVSTYGIDIVLALDVSTSMLAKDFSPNRLEAAKDVAQTFVDARHSDRIGLVIFSGESFTQTPITTDHMVIKEQIEKIENGVLQDGTAIGMGIATSVIRLKDSDTKSKVVILMTDGENNAGVIDPITATQTAIQFGVKIYTIGVGSRGQALTPIAIYPNGQYQYDYMDVHIDEELLKEVASQTGGQYFRADSKEALEEIYEEIDALEKTEIIASQFTRKTERFHPFAFAALLLLLFEFLLRFTLFRSVP